MSKKWWQCSQNTNLDDMESDINNPEKCMMCGEPRVHHPECPSCGYTYCDAQLHGDHGLCVQPTPEKPAEKEVEG